MPTSAEGGAVGGGLGGGAASIAVLLGAGGKGGKRERDRMIELWNKLELSNFDHTQLTFDELRDVANYMPEVYDAIVPSGPQTIQEDPTARAAQALSLNQLQDIAGGGLSLADRLSAREISNSMAQESQRQDLGILRSLAARGMGASGDETQLRMIGNAAAGNQASDLGASAIRAALDRRLAAVGQVGSAAGAMRTADYRTKAYNADAINNFNTQVSQMRTQAAAAAAASRERAGFANAQERQQLATQSQLGRMGLRERQQSRQDTLLGEEFNQRLKKILGQSQAYEALAAYKDRDRAAKEEAIMGIGSGAGSSLGALAFL